MTTTEFFEGRKLSGPNTSVLWRMYGRMRSSQVLKEGAGAAGLSQMV